MGCSNMFEALKDRFRRLRPAWTRKQAPTPTRELQIGYPQNFRKLTEGPLTSSVNIGSEQTLMNKLPETHEAGNTQSPTKFDKTSSKVSQDNEQNETMIAAKNNGHNETMVAAKNKGDTVTKHASTVALVEAAEGQNATTDQAQKAHTEEIV